MKCFIVAATLATVMSAAPAMATNAGANTKVSTKANANAAPTGATTVLTFNNVNQNPAGPGSTDIEAASKGIAYTPVGDSGRMDQSGQSPFGRYATGQTYGFWAPNPQDGGFYGVGGVTGTSAGQLGNVQSSATFMGTPGNSAFSSISVFLGSLDAFNVVKLFYTDGGFDTYNGLQLNNGVDPAAAVNTRATFDAMNGKTYSGISFYNNGGLGSLEFDNLAFTSASTAAVPEPATWAMMLTGIGMVGAASRHRRRGTKAAMA